MSDLKTLAEIWEEADRKPVKVFTDSDPDRNNRFNCFTLIGFFNGFGYMPDGNSMQDSRVWKLHKEKKIVEHWSAVFRDANGDFQISYKLFMCEEAAVKHVDKIHECKFIRLATELPPIMLEAGDENNLKSEKSACNTASTVR